MHSPQEPRKIMCFPAVAKRIRLAKGKPIRHQHSAFFAVACHNGDKDLKVLIKPAGFPVSCMSSSTYFSKLFCVFKFPNVLKRRELGLG